MPVPLGAFEVLLGHVQDDSRLKSTHATAAWTSLHDGDAAAAQRIIERHASREGERFALLEIIATTAAFTQDDLLGTAVLRRVMKQWPTPEERDRIELRIAQLVLNSAAPVNKARFLALPRSSHPVLCGAKALIAAEFAARQGRMPDFMRHVQIARSFVTDLRDDVDDVNLCFTPASVSAVEASGLARLGRHEEAEAIRASIADLHAAEDPPRSTAIA